MIAALLDIRSTAHALFSTPDEHRYARLERRHLLARSGSFISD
jgi:hypothetical protein